MRCSACGIDVSGRHSVCPLCKSALSGTQTPSPFPPNTLEKTSKKARIVLGGITLALIAVATLLCILLNAPAGITLTVIAALLVNYLFARNSILHSPSVFRSIVRYFLVVIALAYVWYLATGSQYVIDYVIPSISIISLVFDSALMALFAHQFISAYSKYVLMNVEIGLIPLAFLAINAVADPALSIVNVIASVATAIAFCLFSGRRLADELRRLLQH